VRNVLFDINFIPTAALALATKGRGVGARSLLAFRCISSAFRFLSSALHVSRDAALETFSRLPDGGINAEPRDPRRKTVNARVRDNDASFNALANNRLFGGYAASVQPCTLQCNSSRRWSVPRSGLISAFSNSAQIIPGAAAACDMALPWRSMVHRAWRAYACVCLCMRVQYITRHCKSRQYRQCARPRERTSRNVICETPSERDSGRLYQNCTSLKFESPESDVPHRGCDNIATSRFSILREAATRVRADSLRAFARWTERRDNADFPKCHEL